MTLIKASITAGIRPTSMILHTQPSKPWNEYDFLILEAYQILENERCSQCGLPTYICHNESRDIQFRLREDLCHVKEKIDRRNDENGKKPNYKPPFGVQIQPEPYLGVGSEFSKLVDYRKPHYEREAEKRAQMRLA